MANPDALRQPNAGTRVLQPTVKSHLAFTLLCALVMMVMFTLLRVALLVYNREMILDTPASTFLEAFANGLRFDLRIVVYLSIPLLLALLSVKAMAQRGVMRFWQVFPKRERVQGEKLLRSFRNPETMLSSWKTAFLKSGKSLARQKESWIQEFSADRSQKRAEAVSRLM